MTDLRTTFFSRTGPRAAASRPEVRQPEPVASAEPKTDDIKKSWYIKVVTSLQRIPLEIELRSIKP
jgi:hypothetical protein